MVSPVETRVETPVKTPDLIMAVLRETPSSTLAEVAATIGKSVSAVERASAKLVDAGKLRYVGGVATGRATPDSASLGYPFAPPSVSSEFPGLGAPRMRGEPQCCFTVNTPIDSWQKPSSNWTAHWTN
jgi:hypothetical protein